MSFYIFDQMVKPNGQRMNEQDSRTKIMHAARKVFVRKGLTGARMQEIADEAGINKSLLHYYFSSKEKLYEMILREAFVTIQAEVFPLLKGEEELFEKLRLFSDKYISFLQENDYIVNFIIAEINRDPKRLVDLFKSNDLEPPQTLVLQIKEEAAKGRIKDTDPFQFVLNVLSLCVFPFIGRPIFQGIFGMGESAYDELIERRKKEVPELLISSLVINENN